MQPYYWVAIVCFLTLCLIGVWSIATAPNDPEWGE